MGIFSTPEIVDMGIEKEKKRRDFYAKAALAFDDKEIRDLFTRLRDWEEVHIKRFGEIKESIKDSQSTGSYPKELEDYISVLLDDTLYKDVTPSEFKKKITTPLSAIQYGIIFEKDAILFFNEFLEHTPRKDVIRQLIEEEKQHIIYLSELKKKLKR
jgi:rubrerythrin